MGLRVFDFRCGRCGDVFEAFVSSTVKYHVCQKCHEEGISSFAAKQLSMPRIALDGCSGDFPTAADAWEKRRESHMRKERKNMENHDSYT